MENNQLAFDVAEREFGIPPVTTGKEMASAQEPDKLSMVMYLSKFYELFRGTPLRPVGKGLLLDEAFPAPEPSLLCTYSLLPFTPMASVLGLTLVPPLPLSLNRGRPCAQILFSRRREWQPTPVFSLGNTTNGRSLADYSPWDHKESDTTEQLTLLCVSGSCVAGVT